MESITEKLKKLLQFSVTVLFFFTFLIFSKILSLCPTLFKKFFKWMHKYDVTCMAKTDYTIEEYADSFAAWSTWPAMYNQVSTF